MSASSPSEPTRVLKHLRPLQKNLRTAAVDEARERRFLGLEDRNDSQEPRDLQEPSDVSVHSDEPQFAASSPGCAVESSDECDS